MPSVSCISVLCFVLIGTIGKSIAIPVASLSSPHEVNTNFPILADDLDSTASQAALLNLLADAENEDDQDTADLGDVSDELTHLSKQNHPVKYGFWSVHPGDLLPMRRLVRPNKRLNAFGIGKRAGYKKSEQNPYHPVPRSATMRTHHNEVTASGSEEGMAEQGLNEDEYTMQKRQSPGSYLLLKLSRMNRPPPTNPAEGKQFYYNRADGRERSRRS